MGLTAIAGISFIDDVMTISNRARLVVQFIAMVLLLYQWGILTFASWWMIPIALICCVGVIKTNDLSYLVLLVVYGVDSVLTIVHRLLLHENIFVAHSKHAYQLLANELKVPHVVVAWCYFIVQLAVTAGFFLCTGLNHWVYLGVVLVLSVAYILFMRKYYWLHEGSSI